MLGKCISWPYSTLNFAARCRCEAHMDTMAEATQSPHRQRWWSAVYDLANWIYFRLLFFFAEIFWAFHLLLFSSLLFFLFCTTNSLINLLLCSDIRRNLYFTKRKKSKHFGKWCVIKNSADHFVCECGAEHAFLSRSQPVQYMRNDNTVELIKQAYICCCDQRNCLYELLEHKSKRFGCQAAAATEQSEPKCMQKKKKKGT